MGSWMNFVSKQTCFWSCILCWTLITKPSLYKSCLEPRAPPNLAAICHVPQGLHRACTYWIWTHRYSLLFTYHTHTHAHIHTCCSSFPPLNCKQLENLEGAWTVFAWHQNIVSWVADEIECTGPGPTPGLTVFGVWKVPTEWTWVYFWEGP